MANKLEKSENQSEKFQKAARELGCDEDEAAFDAKLKKVAEHKPDHPPASGTKKKPGGPRFTSK